MMHFITKTTSIITINNINGVLCQELMESEGSAPGQVKKLKSIELVLWIHFM